MRLSDAFAQVDVDLAEAQAIVTALAKDLSDGNYSLYQKIVVAASNMVVPDDASATSTASGNDEPKTAHSRHG